MGFNFTWTEEDMKRLGNCGLDRERIVYFRIPRAFGSANGSISESPERDSRYAIFDKRLHALDGVDIPEGESGYALEFTEMTRNLTRKEAAQRLRKVLDRDYRDFPKDMKNREAHIEARVNDFLGRGPLGDIGTSFNSGMMRKDKEFSVPQKKFVRWVSKEEYDFRLAEAREEARKREDDEIFFLEAWHFTLKDDEMEAKCRTCPLSTYLGSRVNPVVKELGAQLGKRRNSYERGEFLKGIYKQLVRSRKGNISEGRYRNMILGGRTDMREAIEFLAQSLADSGLKNHSDRLRIEYDQWGPERFWCNKGSCYSHWGTFFDFLGKHGDFKVLKAGLFEDGEGVVPFSLVDKLDEDLRRSRVILETKEIPAMNIHDRKGRHIGVYSHDTGWLSGSKEGYEIGLNGEEGITLVHKAPGLFDVPTEIRREVLKEAGLEGIMALNVQIKEATPKFSLREIVREGNKFYGTTMNGCRVDLPVEIGSGGRSYTPFSGFGKMEARVGRIEFTHSSPMRSFGYLQRVLEKYVEIAGKKGIGIRFS